MPSNPNTTSTQNGAIHTVTTTGLGSAVPYYTGTFNSIDYNIRKEDIIKLQDRLEEIEKRLLILRPNIEKMEKYAALKEAYEAYKIIDGLIGKDE